MIDTTGDYFTCPACRRVRPLEAHGTPCPHCAISDRLEALRAERLRPLPNPLGVDEATLRAERRSVLLTYWPRPHRRSRRRL